MGDDKTFCFIFVVSLCAVDFWVVKNLTGRILVGLRWWSKIKEDGSEEWIFESLGEQRKSNPIDANVFWMASYIAPILWVVFGVISVLSLKLNSLFICLIGATLGGVNLLGFIKCEKNHKAHVKGFLMGQAKKNLSADQMAKIGTMAAKEAMKMIGIRNNNV